MSDYHGIDDGRLPDWLDENQIVFVRENGWTTVEYGPMPAKMVNWSKVSSFRFAQSETTYR